jgi:hypothetical protein
MRRAVLASCKGLTSKKARQSVAENENFCYIISYQQNAQRSFPRDDWTEEKASLQTFRPAEAAKDFFIFIRCNSLKSPDSEKIMKGNERNFPFISFHLFSAARAEP